MTWAPAVLVATQLCAAMVWQIADLLYATRLDREVRWSHHTGHPLMYTLDMYVVYLDRRRYVVRRWTYAAGKAAPYEIVAEGDRLQDVRAELPPWLTRIARRDTDDPAIVEVWL